MGSKLLVKYLIVGYFKVYVDTDITNVRDIYFETFITKNGFDKSSSIHIVPLFHLLSYY